MPRCKIAMVHQDQCKEYCPARISINSYECIQLKTALTAVLLDPPRATIQKVQKAAKLARPYRYNEFSTLQLRYFKIRKSMGKYLAIGVQVRSAQNWSQWVKDAAGWRWRTASNIFETGSWDCPCSKAATTGPFKLVAVYSCISWEFLILRFSQCIHTRLLHSA